ncbi:LLM class F420-dependent oxidoreductase [Streptomonospora salina]|uniref:F420-dependent oxidoreductase-like protein n=1 Tax=Streptomonospora salina TaxID=104205 RepID=A0A841EAH6_9ACTN|nr:LLM class F420-dependent oxidoreductase [Streptomonospora salina]MBB6000006.1 F420-dependent oxidoreductase-like protein [Streptomonospora salina]
MELFITTEPQQGAEYSGLLSLARCAEDAGFEGFFRSDHYQHLGEVAPASSPTDSWISLAGLARETTRIRLGTLVTSATFRHPGPLAITVANVDQMSGGRVEIGLGTGWYEAEHTSYGIPYPSINERFDKLAEQLAIITGLWTSEGPYSFNGKHYTLTDSPALAKPVQSPHPPVIVGGTGKRRTPDLAARFANEYNLPFGTPKDAAGQYQRVAEACTSIGRDPRSLRLSAVLPVCVGPDEATVARRAAATGFDPAVLREIGVAGTPAEAVDALGRWGEAGARRVYLQVLDMTDFDHVEYIASQVARQR